MTYLSDSDENSLDSVFYEAVRVVIEHKQCSSSFLQRRLKLGYARSARLVDQLEDMGVVGPSINNKPREIYFDNVDKFGKIINKRLHKKHFEEVIPMVWKKKIGSDINDLKITLDNEEKVFFDFEKYKNLLIIGSQQTNALDLINNIIYRCVEKYSPEDLKIIIIDGVRNEILLPPGTSHLITPAIYQYEMALNVLRWSLSEIDRRQKNHEAKKVKTLIVINSINQFADFKKDELMTLIYRVLIQGKDQGFHLIINTDFPTKIISKEIIASMGAFVFFKQSDKKVIRDFNISKTEEFTTPNQTLFTSIFEDQKVFEIEKIDHKKEYKNIFE